MGLHVYCIVRAGAEPPRDLVGLDGARLDAVRVGSIAAWCSEHERSPRATLEHIETHDRIVRAAARGGTPLPSRFGQWFSGRDRLRGRMLERSDELERALREVDGAFEFAVRLEASAEAGAHPSHDPAPRPGEGELGPGTAYLRGLARQRAERERTFQRGESLLRELERRLEGRLRGSRIDPSPGQGGLASAAHLVPLEQIDPYRTVVAEFASQRPEVELATLGPWPPYSFAP